MKKILFTIVTIFTTGLCATSGAETYFSIRQGIPTMSGIIETPTFTAFTGCDPFMMEIGGERYYMLKTSSTYDYTSLVGCDGTQKTTLFSPLWVYDVNKDSKITSKELESAKIRFVRYKNRQKLATDNETLDFPIKKISYIDLTNTRITPARRAYGNFDVYIHQDKSEKFKKIIGRVTSIHKIFAENMF